MCTRRSTFSLDITHQQGGNAAPAPPTSPHFWLATRASRGHRAQSRWWSWRAASATEPESDG